MSYNPNRQGAAPKRQRKLDPRAGHRYSDVVNRFGPSAATVDDVRNKVNSDRGWRVDVHKGDTFEMIYEFICARNATGVIKNEEQDRALRVLSGSLFVTSAGEVFELRAGSSYAFPAGTEYQIATSGDMDVEVIFCQGADYEDNIEQITDPAVSNAATPRNLSIEEKHYPPKVDRTKALEHAAKIQSDRKERDKQIRAKIEGRAPVDPEEAAAEPVAEPVEASAEPVAEGEAPAPTPAAAPAPVKRAPPPGRRAPLAGQEVRGVNPRPIGAGGYGGE